MNKFKYLREFQNFNSNGKVNEEIGWETVLRAGMELGALAGGGKTISLQQAREVGGSNAIDYQVLITRSTQPTPDTKGKISREEETGHYAYYNNTEIKANLPTGQQTHYLRGKKSDILKAISDSGPYLQNFKFISLEEAKGEGLSKQKKDSNGNDVTDFLKIGDKIVENEGALTFNLNGPDEEIVVSGNGLWVLIRAVAKQKQLKEIIPIVRVEMGISGVKSKFKDVQIIDGSTQLMRQGQMTRIYYSFELATEFGKNVPSDGVADKTNIRHLVGQSDSVIVDDVYNLITAMVNDFVPTGLDLSNMKFNTMSKENISKYLEDFKRATDDGTLNSERDMIFKKFISEINDMYIENINNFVNDYLTKDALPLETIESTVKNLEKTTKYYNVDEISTRFAEEGAPKQVKKGAIKLHANSSSGRVISQTKTTIKPEIKKGEQIGEPGKLTPGTTGFESTKDSGIKKESFKFLRRFNNF